MRKILYLALFLLITASAPLMAGDRGASSCASHIKTLMQAVELWSNDHRGHFPTTQEWGSTLFMEYVKKAGASEPSKEIKCPQSGKPYLYKAGNSNFEITCPVPDSHGLETLFYSRDRGFVRKGTPETAAAPTTPAGTGKTRTVPPVPVMSPKHGGTKPPPPTPAFLPGKKTPRPLPTEQASAATPDMTPQPPTPEKTGKPLVKVDGSSTYEDIAQEDKEGIITVIQDLYNAYSGKNLERIMELQHDSMEASALDYQKKKKGSADEVREAFKSATKEIIEHKDFKMLPLNLNDLSFQKKGTYCKVTGVAPIISTERLEVQEEGKFFFVRLRVGELILEKKNDLWKIANMYLY
jgi:hypothetical protein